MFMICHVMWKWKGDGRVWGENSAKPVTAVRESQSPGVFVATKTGILSRILIFPWPWTTEVVYDSIITELLYHKIEKWTTFILAVVEVWLEEISSCMKLLTTRSVAVTLRSWLQKRKIECHLVPLTSRETTGNNSCITQQFAAVRVLPLSF